MGRSGKIEVIARGLIQVGSSYLLCRNVEKGYCYLPGGHVEFGESAAAALERELIEEAGLRVTVGRLMMASEVIFEQGGKRRHELNLVFHVEPASGVELDTGKEVASLEEGIGFDWVEQAAVVETDLRPGVIRAWLVSGEVFEAGQGAMWLGATGV